MATSIISGSQILPQQPSAASSTLPKSFLSRCVEDLSPDKISSFDRQSTLWLVAAGVTFVAFTALAVGAFVAVAVFAPVYVPFAGMGALIVAMPVANFVKNFLQYSESAKNEANNYSAIQQGYRELSVRNPLQIQVDLTNRGILWFQIPGVQISQPERLASLNPILAQAQHLDGQICDYLQTKDQLTAEARELANVDFTANRQKIFELRNAALFAEDRAMETKIQAAFVNAVLRKSDFNGTLEDIASLTKIGYQERILGNELNERSGLNEFLKFKNRTLVPLSQSDIKTMTVAQLGQRLAAAMV